MAAKGAREKVVEIPEEMTDESMANLSRAQYNDHFETHQTLLQAKNAELTRLTDMLRSVREAKEPLAKVKATLQGEITKANEAINAKSEEVTLIKQKLRYHSERQINENIERLEYQLRNNNYKPREEQKILDEISMLQRSKKTLREYEEKQAENKKYRSERARLIDERNSNYSKIRAMYAQEEEIKKAMAELRGVISNSKKSIDQLKLLKPSLEKSWNTQQQQQQQSARNKRLEENRSQRLEQPKPRDRQEMRRKTWGKYEVPKEPYEEECDNCRVLIRYLQSSMNLATPVFISSPSVSRLTPTTPLETPSTPASDPEYVGSFYMKPKDDDGFIKVSKREKARAKREHRLSNRVKDLPHTPDVLLKFSKLSIFPPKNTDGIPAAVIALQDALQHFNNLYMEAKRNNNRDGNIKCKDAIETFTYSRPTTLAFNPPKLIVTEDTSTPAMTLLSTLSQLETPTTPHVIDKNKDILPPSSIKNLENPPLPSMSNLPLDTSSISPKITTPQSTGMTMPTKTWATAVATNKYTNPEATSLLQEISVVRKEEPEQEVLCNGVYTPEALAEASHFAIKSFVNKGDRKICNGMPLSSNDSFFTPPISYPTKLVEVNNNAARSYASVTAKLNAARMQES